MSINKIAKNKYKIIIECGYDIFGKRKRHTEIFIGTNVEAIIKEAELTKQYYHKGKQVNTKNLTFEEYNSVFIKQYCLNNVSKITLRGYKQMLKTINKYIGLFKLTDITSFILDSMYQKIRNGEKGKELSSKTMLHYYSLVNIMLKQAVKWNLIDKNVNVDAQRPKVVKKERNFYDRNQINMLLSSIKNENIKYRALIVLALDSGARRSEICALRWSDVDFENETLLIDNSLKVVDGVVDEESTKTEYSKRKIYISPATLEILREYKKWQDEYILQRGAKWVGTDRIFTSNTGKYMHPDTCDKIISKVLKKYNLSKLQFHELRHTSCTVLLEDGISLKATSERLGHANPRTTMEIYAHVYDDTKKLSAQSFDRIISNN